MFTSGKSCAPSTILSETICTSTSIGIQEITCPHMSAGPRQTGMAPTLGRHPSATLDLTRIGDHSVVFHTPLFLEPQICPTLSVVVLNPALRAFPITYHRRVISLPQEPSICRHYPTSSATNLAVPYQSPQREGPCDPDNDQHVLH